jgi:hypothetical protein
MTSRNDNKEFRALETVSILALACIALGFLLKRQEFFYAAMGLLLIGIFARRVSVIISDTWLKFASILGKINTLVILTLIYFLVLFPLAIIFRFVKGDFMNIGRNSSKTFWIERNHKFSPEDLKKPW